MGQEKSSDLHRCRNDRDNAASRLDAIRNLPGNMPRYMYAMTGKTQLTLRGFASKSSVNYKQF
jgi:hypothetical protein